ncbi:hypothetical protein ASPTUDRAFT_26004 [Aspergillus tubingensis CBS 134.48]|uniref:Secreted protein n=1 Tax=Aspergillus tubingensis (strain CBS 134.48) TaxID=767770 RepID=A0A1L9NMJ1_ASPTC|nr:hypothetical protein ASPTUDRAFT_26004 [Aspergillus tubingensis CBS 134.48]
MGGWLALLLLLLLLCRVCVLAMGGTQSRYSSKNPRLRYRTPTAMLNAYALPLSHNLPQTLERKPLRGRLRAWFTAPPSSPSVVPRPTGVERTPRHTLRARKEKKTKEPGESGESTVFETDNGREHDRNKYKSNKTHTATSE